MKRWVLDVETDGLGHPGKPPRQLLAVGYRADERVVKWGSDACSELVEEISCSVFDAEIWAHYGGGFDFRFCAESLLREGFSGRWTHVGSHLLSVVGKTRWGTTLALRDSWRLLPGKLQAIAESWGGSKLAMQVVHGPHCKKDVESRCPACLAKTKAGRERLLARCVGDCEILWRAIAEAESLLASLGLTRLRTTLASCAAATLKERGAPSKLERDVDDECGGAAHGGKVTVYRPRCGEARFYDVRSMYAWAMSSTPLPWIYKGEHARAKWDSLGVTHCEVDIPEQYDPPLPWRRRDGRLLFPWGRLRGWWSTEELAAALELDDVRVLRVFSQHRFGGSDVMGDWAVEAFEKRRKTLGFERYFWKIYLNAAFGKTIEGREKDMVVSYPKSRRGLRRVHQDLPLWAKDVEYDPPLRAPAAGAAITARARIKLRALHAQVVGLGGRAYYCDTDSLVVSGAMLATGENLGELHEEARIERGWFAAPKLYAYEGTVDGEKKTRVRAKGMPGLTSLEDFLAVLRGVSWEYERTVGWREALRRGDVGFDRVKVSKTLWLDKPKRRWVGGEGPLDAEDTVPWRVDWREERG